MKSTEICLVLKHLEGVSSEIFDDHHEIISDFVSGQPGVYALYRKGRLYYVGLATNLRGRLKIHRKDIHKNRWDTFSAYLTDGGKYLRELEALLIRIAQPKGNSIRGHFPRSEDLRKRLRRDIDRHNREKTDEIFGIKKKTSSQPKGKQPRQKAPKSLPLIAYYKGATYKARAFPDGTVRIGDKEYGSLSRAGVAITRQTACSGWLFWRARSSDGEWLKINELRKRGEWPFLKTAKVKSTKPAKVKSPSKKSTKSTGKAQKLVGKYKGKIYRATLRPDGKVRMGVKLYGSLSGAAFAITGHQISGPVFWKV